MNMYAGKVVNIKFMASMTLSKPLPLAVRNQF